MASNLDHTPAWLFPGRQPGTPMHPAHLARRLGELGIDCRASRNTVLLHLAAEVPPRSWPTCSASTRPSRPSGPSAPAATGPLRRRPPPQPNPHRLQAAMTPHRESLMTNDPTSISRDDPDAGGHGAFGLWSDLRTWQQRGSPNGCPVCQSIRSTGQPAASSSSPHSATPSKQPLPTADQQTRRKPQRQLDLRSRHQRRHQHRRPP
jgi:hypothetical protein